MADATVDSVIRQGPPVALALSLACACGGDPRPSAPDGGEPPADAAAPDAARARVAPVCSAHAGRLPPLRLEEVVTGLNAPIAAVSPPGDPRLFVAEIGGLVRVVEDGVLAAEPFADLSAEVLTGSVDGLQGIAFHPDFAANGRWFAHYTSNLDAAAVLCEREAGGTEEKVFFRRRDAGKHNGGNPAFGADGMLYLPTGDGGGSGDPREAAQDPAFLDGKILRLDVDAGDPYAPAGNWPGGAPEVWDVGLRNPWRMAFDPCTGDLYVGDVGQISYEEIDVEPAGQGGRNYGWDVNEGAHCYDDAGDPALCARTFTPPVVDYDHGEGCAVIGGVVYRGAAIPGLRGRYLYGDWCTGRIWSFVWDGERARDPIELTEDLESEALAGLLVAFGQDAAGEVYLVAYDGRILRVVSEW